jgi:hypothetical protein
MRTIGDARIDDARIDDARIDDAGAAEMTNERRAIILTLLTAGAIALRAACA